MQSRLLMLIFCLVVMLVGCGGKDYVYEDGRDLKQGPGLLSGKDGVFIVYKKEDPFAPAAQTVQGLRAAGVDEKISTDIKRYEGD